MAKNDKPDTDKKSIIGGDYAKKYRERGADWIGELIDKQCVAQDDKGKPTGLVIEDLFGLAEVNGIDVTKYRTQVDRPNAVGRLRMTIGNMLRARAKRRHGLYATDQKWVKAPKEFLESIDAPEKPTEQKDGTKIVAPKPKAEKKETKKDEKAAA